MEAERTGTQVNRRKIGWAEFTNYITLLASNIRHFRNKYDYIFPVAKNGMYVAHYLQKELYVRFGIEKSISHTAPSYARALVVDDLIDSGRTLAQYSGIDKAVLFVKNGNEDKVDYYVEKTNDWIIFPWEKEEDIEKHIVRMLEYIGENPNREGLIETPKRIKKSWSELYAGYNQKVEDVVKVFEEGACDEMVVLKDIEFYSMCEHHMLPFFGKCHIAYIPDKKVIGVSKLARILEVYARRMQIQERLTGQIADCLMSLLQAKGVMVVMEAVHFCMVSRGIQKQNSKMVTSAIRGGFKEPQVREEFLNLIK